MDVTRANCSTRQKGSWVCRGEKGQPEHQRGPDEDQTRPREALGQRLLIPTLEGIFQRRCYPHLSYNLL